ncbi:hypothetical protein D3C84_969510 [compost metagenome]
MLRPPLLTALELLESNDSLNQGLLEPCVDYIRNHPINGPVRRVLPFLAEATDHVCEHSKIGVHAQDVLLRQVSSSPVLHLIFVACPLAERHPLYDWKGVGFSLIAGYTTFLFEEMVDVSEFTIPKSESITARSGSNYAAASFAFMA